MNIIKIGIGVILIATGGLAAATGDELHPKTPDVSKHSEAVTRIYISNLLKQIDSLKANTTQLNEKMKEVEKQLALAQRQLTQQPGSAKLPTVKRPLPADVPIAIRLLKEQMETERPKILKQYRALAERYKSELRKMRVAKVGKGSGGKYFFATSKYVKSKWR